LGFPAESAVRLQAASHTQINDTWLIKKQLTSKPAEWIAEHHLKQAEAAEILIGVAPEHV